MTDTDVKLDRIIELLELLVRQNQPPPDMLYQEYVAKMKEALNKGDRQALKAVNKSYHAHRGIKI